MAQASIESSMSGQAGSSTAATILRDDDALSHALREGTDLDLVAVACLDRAMSPAHDALSSLGTTTTPVSGAHNGSTITKPTSTSTTHLDQAYNQRDKERAEMSDASSLAGTHGSASEADLQCTVLRRDNLLSMGNWADEQLAPAQPLRGAARAKERSQYPQQPKQKKPIVILTQEGRSVPSAEHIDPVFTPTIIVDGRGKNDEDPLRLVEEGQAQPTSLQTTKYKALSRMRVYILTGFIFLIVLTVALSAYGAHVTGKGRMRCTKGIVFAATALLACFTVLAMITARRALSEALLAGLLEFVFGFALLVELDDFM